MVMRVRQYVMNTGIVRRPNSRWLTLATCTIACCFTLAVATPAQITQDVKDRIDKAVSEYKAGHLDVSLKSFQDLNKDAPNSIDVQGWLGFLYLRTNEGAKAVPLLKRAAAARPNDLEILSNLGAAYVATGDDEQAMAQYERVARLKPAMSEPHYNLGNIYLRRKDYATAEAEFKESIRLKPSDAFSYNNLGAAYEGDKEIVEAASAYGHASDTMPDAKTFARNAGFAWLRAREPGRAIDYLVREHKIDPSDSKAAMALADCYTRTHHREEALATYEELKQSQASSASFWFNLGVLRAQNGNEAGAEEAYRQALTINGTDLDTLNNLGVLLFNQKRYVDAQVLFDKLAGLNPSSVAARLSLAACAAKAGDLPKAIDAWKSALQLDPARVSARIELANALWQTSDFEGAHVEYARVLTSDPNNAEGWNGEGLYRLRTSKLADAKGAFKKSVACNPKFMAAYNNLAITMERMNDKKAAISVLENALKIKEDPALRQNLERMRAQG